ncbi:MAG TPA: NAD(+) synthase, partial [Dongiaceae bacterium]|nr:NAD(+) synthase [Dongiaceae bacterium]
MPQGQDEFYYALPYQEMDIALWCYNHKKPVAELARILEVAPEQAQFVYTDIESKRRTTAPLHWPAILIEPVPL